MGFNSFLSKIFGNKSQRDMKELYPYVDKIKSFESELSHMSNDDLRCRVQDIRRYISDYVKSERSEIDNLRKEAEGKELEDRESIWAKIDKKESEIQDRLEVVLDEVMPEVFAIVKETAKRFANNETITVSATDMDRELAVTKDFVTIDGDKAIYKNRWIAGGNEIVWDMVHYDVQMIGGTVLHKGKIAEMATGEGKTLVATFPVFLNALTGNGVHVVTVNDYLSKRDSEWMGPLYMFHGLSVDCIDKHQPNTDARRRAYNADITFGTNNEFGFDYLRDNMANSPDDLVQRKHNYAIVDEVDSVLIDDARTPLIIAGPVPKGDVQMFEEFLPNVEKVVNAQKNLCKQLLIDAKKKIDNSSDKKEIEEGYVLLYRSFKGLPKNKQLIKYLSEPGVKAGMLKTEEYYMQDNMRQMHIITDDLFFVIDEKHNSIELTDKGIDLLTQGTEDPQFFVLPDIGSELSELENKGLSTQEFTTQKDELLSNYSVKSERVHTINQLLKAYTLFEKDDQYVVVDNKVMIVDEQTGRIMDGRRYSDGLHQAIEAKERVKVEAATQTFATITLQNYFRMYHKLSGMTGTAETEAGEFWDIYKLDVVVIPTNKPIARKDLNDRIYKTAREKYAAVIQEIQDLKEKGRPVLVGTTSVEISELLSKMLRLRGINHNVLNAKLHQKEAEIVAQAGQKGMVTIATNMAGRGTDIKLSKEVKEAGGLAIIGTERHESRRVDRQLRGRSGRQGDPGSSIFFLSLEDHLMRLFASDRLAKMMDRLGFKEGEVLEHSFLTKQVEKAQKKVEENNFGIRKRLLEYDDVMNSQREVIYTRRRHALMGERIETDIINTLYDASKVIVDKNQSSQDYNSFKEELFRIFAVESSIKAEEFAKLKADDIHDRIFSDILNLYKQRTDKIAEMAYPVIKQIYDDSNTTYERIMIPLSDGKNVYHISCNISEAVNTKGRSIIKEFEKNIVLKIIDESWKDHLREMDELRNSVQNASYEQKDPLLIYKLESYELFRNMLDRMNSKTVSVLMRIHIQMAPPNTENETKTVDVSIDRNIEKNQRVTPKYTTRKDDFNSANNGEQKNTPVRVEHTIGRNEPCPCGSGKKFKQCHGR